MKLKTPIASVAALVTAASFASADTITVTVTGTVNEDYNAGGFFGSSGSLSGMALTGVYVFDTGIPGIGHYDDAATHQIYGSPNFGGVASPLVSSSLKINNHSVTFSGNSASIVSGFNDGANSQLIYEVDDLFDAGIAYFGTSVANSVNTIPSSITTSFTYIPTQQDDQFSSFKLVDANSGAIGNGTFTVLRIDFAVNDTAPVPGPIAGAGLPGLKFAGGGLGILLVAAAFAFNNLVITALLIGLGVVVWLIGRACCYMLAERTVL
jgi:hypothetical protein